MAYKDGLPCLIFVPAYSLGKVRVCVAALGTNITRRDGRYHNGRLEARPCN